MTWALTGMWALYTHGSAFFVLFGGLTIERSGAIRNWESEREMDGALVCFCEDTLYGVMVLGVF